MRLDKWLKVSRLIKRRTVANEACDSQRVTRVEVLAVSEHAGKDDAPALYKEL